MKFDRAEVEHILREHNTGVGGLSNLVSMRKKGGKKSITQETRFWASIKKSTSLLDARAIGDSDYWMTPVYIFLTKGDLPSDQKEAATTKQRTHSYVLVEDKLYRKGFSIPLLKYVEETKAPNILQELHEGINT